MEIPMTYYYKGSSNCCVHIAQNKDNMFDLTTDYGELIATVWSGTSLAKVLIDLENDKYV